MLNSPSYISEARLFQILPDVKIFKVSTMCMFSVPCRHYIEITCNDDNQYWGELSSKQIKKILLRYPEIHNQCSTETLMHIFDF